MTIASPPVPLHLLQVTAREERDEGVYLVYALVPPPEFQEQPDELVVETSAQLFGGIAYDDGVGLDVAPYDAVGSDDRAVADMHAGEDDRVLPDPDIVADDRVALERKVRR